MEWIDQFQQSLSRPVLAFLREYWMFVLPIAIVLVWSIWTGGGSPSTTVSTDLTLGDGDGGDGDGGGDGGGD